MIYLIGSLRNPEIPVFANELRANGFIVFDDWYSPGPETDENWQQYEKTRGRSYLEALKGPHATTCFNLDKSYLEACTSAILMLPAGKSAHLELGWVVGKGKAGFILLPGEPERYDIMYQFATGIYTDKAALMKAVACYE